MLSRLHGQAKRTGKHQVGGGNNFVRFPEDIEMSWPLTQQGCDGYWHCASGQEVKEQRLFSGL